MIAIIDYGAGNVQSMKNALDYLGVQSRVTSNPEDIKQADRVILPGVGAFGDCIKALEERKLIQPIKDFINSGKSFLGICIGLQVLFESSEESPGIKGLGIVKGIVKRFTKGKVPQIGWNKIKSENPLFTDAYMYFVNSYYAKPKEKSVIAATSDYYGDFTAAIQNDNITATQFHPEKSGKQGLALLKRWLGC